MIDIVGNKENYQGFKAGFFTLDKEHMSLKKLTDNDDEDDEPVRDLHTVIHHDPDRDSRPSVGSRNNHNPVLGRSSSWDSPGKNGQEQKQQQQALKPTRSHSLNSLKVLGGAENNPISNSTLKSKSRRHISTQLDMVKTIMPITVPASSTATYGTEKTEKKNWLSAEKRKSKESPSKSHSLKLNAKKKSITKKDTVFRGLSGKKNTFQQDGETGKVEDKNFQKMEDESLESSSGNISTGVKEEQKGKKIEKSFTVKDGGTGPIPKSGQLKGSKTAFYAQYGEEDREERDPEEKEDRFDREDFEIKPSDIILQTQEKEAVEIPPVMMVSQNQPVDTYEAVDERTFKLRYGKDFFNKHIMNRTGVPTITAKKRENTGVLNLNSFGAGSSIPQAFSQDTQLCFQQQNENGKTMNISLLKEMASIEQQKRIKMKMEQFVLHFNKKADQGINYLISSNLVEDSPEKIAQALLVTEGLNKEMIGEYLGSHKERNRQVLKAYCEVMDFRKLEFDQALRLLLSRFKLPGEAQQIERIVNVFASVYHSDNPDVFNDEDTPFILAYSLLMLNTDAHSDLIQGKNKMSRTQFIENNIKICKTLTREYLGRMYDNIVKRKFETKADYIETIYNRLHQGHFNLQGESLRNLFDLAKVLMTGSKFIKYGRKGKSHERKVWISEKEDALLWTSPSVKNDKPRTIPFSEIRDILVGHNSTPVLMKNKVPSEFDSVTLSIVSTNRTLDLRAPDVETRAKWERYFRLLLLQRKDKSKGRGGLQQRKKLEKEKLSEIWKVDILPNWEYHWDYENRKPKNLNQTFHQKAGKKNPKAGASSGGRKSHSRTSSFWSIFRRKKKSAKKYEKSLRENDENNNNNQHEIIKVEDLSDDNDDTEFNLLCKNKSLLLVTVWKKGIPDWLRSILWPISIGNQLEITENLYEILLSQAKIFLSTPIMAKSTIHDSLRRMELDLDETLHSFPDIKDRKESLVNILEAFVFYRPDVGYVKGMCRLIIILLFYCSEYQAFSCFINLTHSHHFISFFRGIMREIEWRIRFFNKVFKEELPHLYDHFNALDLSSEMFLLEWFLSLFSMTLSDVDILSRIWDCFLLEGEVYAIKAGVAILKYFELELKMLTFDGAIKFLKYLPHEIDEDLFFSLTERVDVSWKDYQDELESQKVAEINSKVHQALLEN